MARTHFSPRMGHRFGAAPAFLSAAAGTVTASATTVHDIGGFHRKGYLFRANASCSTVPVSASGTVEATLVKYDASADAAVPLSAVLQLEGLTAHESAPFVLLTSLTEAQRRLDEGDVLYVSIVSDAAIGTAAVNLRFTVEAGILE
jgi:hypothetical protein